MKKPSKIFIEKAGQMALMDAIEKGMVAKDKPLELLAYIQREQYRAAVMDYTRMIQAVFDDCEVSRKEYNV